MTARMDDIKRLVCDHVQAACDKLELPADMAYAVQHVTPLETMIRIPTDQGPRYFSVKVTEKL